jgi:hypothetical protein
LDARYLLGLRQGWRDFFFFTRFPFVMAPLVGVLEEELRKGPLETPVGIEVTAEGPNAKSSLCTLYMSFES